MDPSAIRQQLDEVRGALSRNEEEHEVLVSLMKGYEGWLRLNPEPQPSFQMVPEPVAKPGRNASKGRNATKGTQSFRSAVLQVLRAARGEPLNVREILIRVTALGAVTGAKNPLGAVDLMAYSLAKNHPVFKVGPRTWRYIPPPLDLTESSVDR